MIIDLNWKVAFCLSGASRYGRCPSREIPFVVLADMTGSPVVELNRAVAVAMADGPAAGLALLRGLEAGGALAGYYLVPATQADFLRRLGRYGEAASAYEEAIALAGTGPERRFLNGRLAEVRSRHT